MPRKRRQRGRGIFNFLRRKKKPKTRVSRNIYYHRGRGQKGGNPAALAVAKKIGLPIAKKALKYGLRFGAPYLATKATEFATSRL